METASLQGRQGVTVDGITIEAPDVEGEVAVHRGTPPRPGAERVRRGGRRGSDRGGDEGAAGLLDPSLERALRRQGMRTHRTIAIDGRRRPTRGAPAPVTIRVPRPRRGRGQVVLVIDHGIATWHHRNESQVVPPEAPRRGTRRGAGATAPVLTYEIPQVAPPEERITRSGLISISSIVRIITFPISHVVGEVARFAARRWDLDHHPAQVRAYHADGTLTDLTDADWARLATGPVLLWVHGTFSTTSGAFAALPAATRAELDRRYGGRVIAYDHPTIADDPFVNARAFYDIVGDHHLDVDIVCHSRGGLVARSIAERPGSLSVLGPNVRARQIVLVGAVNHGTILADADHWAELLDRFTTLLNLVPLPGAADTIETVLAVVKSIAVETTHDLEGLSAMAPSSAFLASLNVPVQGRPAATYRALGSNFEPNNPDLKAWLNDTVRDGLFDNKPNDMMVSIESMTGANGSDRFPIPAASIRAFEPADAVEHAMYFGQAMTTAALEEWLTGA
jgi:hypothetical protein